MGRERSKVTYFVISNKSKSQIVVLPTGAGKSLCFQLPSVLLPGATLVLVPLLWLLADQVRKLRDAGVATGCCAEAWGQRRKSSSLLQFATGRCRFVLATPEACQVESTKARLHACRFSHLVVDEAHCVSQWGRPSGLPIGRSESSRAELDVPLRTAFIATASEPVIARIRQLLFDEGEVRLVTAAPDRPNIAYCVCRTLSVGHELEDMVRAAPRPLVAFLSRQEQRRARRARHAPTDVRREAALLPRGTGTVEAYLQETGRAGRDGKPSRAILLLSREDCAFAAGLPEGPSRRRYERMLGYALSRGICRRQVLLELIGSRAGGLLRLRCGLGHGGAVATGARGNRAAGATLPAGPPSSRQRRS